MIHNLFVLFPEISLVVLGFFVQVLGLSKCSNRSMILVLLSSFVLIVYTIFRFHLGFTFSIFNGSFVQNDYTIFCKILVFIFSVLVIINYIGYYRSIFKEFQSEYIVLILFTAVGASIAISARDFLILFLAFELQSLSCYILASFNRDNILSSEAGLKYFILGALSSCFMLFGISFIYGFTGTISYAAINQIITVSNHNIAIIVGIMFIFSSFMFKLSIFPFHAWTPDVYEGSPIISMNLFSSVQKISVLSVLIVLCSICIKSMNALFHDIIMFLSIISILIGSIGGIIQKSIKRIIAYSTILNMGYCLIPLTLWSDASFEAALKYLIIYVASTIAFLALLTSCLGAKAEYPILDDLIGIGRNKKAAAVSITLLMFSMIGIPPMAGFFGKYYILYNALSNHEYALVFFLLIGSVISSFYYLNIIKYMYFCDNLTEESTSKLNIYLLLVIALSLGFILFYSIIPTVHFNYFVVSV